MINWVVHKIIFTTHVHLSSFRKPSRKYYLSERPVLVFQKSDSVFLILNTVFLRRITRQSTPISEAATMHRSLKLYPYIASKS